MTELPLTDGPTGLKFGLKAIPCLRTVSLSIIVGGGDDADDED